MDVACSINQLENNLRRIDAKYCDLIKGITYVIDNINQGQDLEGVKEELEHLVSRF